MADELSIEETNALRAKIGLPPLKPRAAPAVVLNDTEPTIHISSEKSAKEEEEESSGQEDDDNEEEDFDLPNVTDAADGSVLVLNDVEVLGKKKKNNKSKLVQPGSKVSFDENEDEEGEEGLKKKKTKKVDKKNFVAALARSDEPIKPVEEPVHAPISGAKLFESDAVSMDVEETNGSHRKRMKKDLKGSTKEQVKIIRRQVHRGTVAVAKDDDENDKEERAPSTLLQPKVFGSGATREVEEDDDDVQELALSLARARKVNQQQQQPAHLAVKSLSQTPEINNDEYEVFVPSSQFSRIETKSVKTKQVNENAQPAKMDVEMTNSNEAVSPVKQEPKEATLLEGTTSSGTLTIPTQETEDKTNLASNNNDTQKPKMNRRGLAATLAALRAEGGGKRDEIIVGRANDAKPLTDINKPGDLVKLEYRDDHGRLLTQKEGYRQLMYQFRGEGPGHKKQKKREERLAKEQAARSAESAASGVQVTDLTKAMKKDHVVLWKN